MHRIGENLLEFQEQQGLISIYIHVPFCSKKCPYCHFAVRKDKLTEHELWRSSILKDLQKNTPIFKDKTLISIYFGGGTPSLAAPSDLKAILDFIFHNATKLHPDLEITLEANPESLDEQKLLFYRHLGINRLSVGVQSFDDALLKKLGRTHDSAVAWQGIQTAAKVGFTNISIDLMYDIPLQDLTSWVKTLQIATSLPISHLSLYNLTIEPATMFFRQKSVLEKQVPSSEDSLQMLELAVSVLESQGFNRYEISAFARNNQFSLHNTGYWLGRDFLGVGPSAFSFIKGRRFCNKLQLPAYAEALDLRLSPLHFEESLPFPKNLQESLAIGLRLYQGVNLPALEDYFGPLPRELCQTLDLLEKQAYLKRCKNRLYLTKQGVLFYDDVASRIV